MFCHLKIGGDRMLNLCCVSIVLGFKGVHYKWVTKDYLIQYLNFIQFIDLKKFNRII